jgi:hypothetical protein
MITLGIFTSIAKFIVYTIAYCWWTVIGIGMILILYCIINDKYKDKHK